MKSLKQHTGTEISSVSVLLYIENHAIAWPEKDVDAADKKV